MSYICGQCNGSGEGRHEFSICWKCRGWGELKERCDTCMGEGVLDERQKERRLLESNNS